MSEQPNPPKFTHKDFIQDPLWTAVDDFAMSHCHPPSRRPNASILTQTLLRSKAAGLPDISASPAQAKFMALHCRLQKVTHALEVGTLGGYTAIWLASENPSLKLVTVEHNPSFAAVARENIALAGLSDRIEVIEGKGLDVLDQLQEEVLVGKRERFGFTFIDADKPNNYNYFCLAMEMAVPKSVICIDNVVRGGRIVDLEVCAVDEKVKGGRDAIELVGKDLRVDSVVVQTVGEKSYDGALWAVLNE